MIQPMLLAPVLPGETLKRLLFQSRVVSDPIKNPIIGWWKEYYFFYVKHRDMDARDTLTAMMLNVSQDVSALKVAAQTAHYHTAASFDWAEMCKKRVVMEYFRDGAETYTQGTVGSLPAASINQQSWLDSAYLDDDIPDTADMSESIEGFDQEFRTWSYLRSQQLTQMDYEDWLATFGVRRDRVAYNKPELIRYVRDWTYPTNTIDPTSGAARSAVSWSFQERADKDRFFTEPGFIFGCTVTRPKVYRTQDGNLVDWAMDVTKWMPAVLRDDPYTSLTKFSDTTGPLATAVADVDGYWVDMRDLYLYGDQFINYATPTKAQLNIVARPGATVKDWKYPGDTDASALFVDETTNRLVREDGVVTLEILGRESDAT